MTQATDDFFAYWDSDVTFTGPDDTGVEEATNTNYSEIQADDGNYWVTDNGPAASAQLFKFYVAEPLQTVSQLDLKWNGYGATATGYQMTFYIWNYNSSSWEFLDSKDFVTTTDADLTGVITNNISDYIDSDGEVVILISDPGSGPYQ